MLTIRLTRGGAKKRPFYRVVVANSKSPRDGRYVENIGFFNPIARGQDVRLKLKSERVSYWISQGAQPSKRVEALIKEFLAQVSEKEAA